MSREEEPRVEKSELTRRQWLLRLGQITMLAGVAGVVPGTATTLAAAEETAAAVLPPGLYEPSAKHLIHALGARGAAAIPPGSETDYVRPRLGPFQPRFFPEEEFRTLSRLVEILMGNVDAGTLAEVAEWIDLRLATAAGVRAAARRLGPLHRALAVAHFGEARVVEVENEEPESVVRAGLSALLEDSRRRKGRPFLELSPAEQGDVVQQISQMGEGTPLRRFYDLLRREAIRGYYTSRAGLADLDYQGNAFHAQCPGCNAK